MPSTGTFIASYDTLLDHPKLDRMAFTLKKDPKVVFWHLHALWHWACVYAEDGDLSGFLDEEIAKGACWPISNAAEFVKALKTYPARYKHGFLEENGKLHDWHDFAGKLMERRRADRDRKADTRKRNDAERPQAVRKTSAGSPVERPTDTTRNGAGVPVPQYSTVQNSTVPTELKAGGVAQKAATPTTTAAPPPALKNDGNNSQRKPPPKRRMSLRIPSRDTPLNAWLQVVDSPGTTPQNGEYFLFVGINDDGHSCLVRPEGSQISDRHEVYPSYIFEVEVPATACVSPNAKSDPQTTLPLTNDTQSLADWMALAKALQRYGWGEDKAIRELFATVKGILRKAGKPDVGRDWLIKLLAICMDATECVKAKTKTREYLMAFPITWTKNELTGDSYAPKDKYRSLASCNFQTAAEDLVKPEVKARITTMLDGVFGEVE